MRATTISVFSLLLLLVAAAEYVQGAPFDDIDEPPPRESPEPARTVDPPTSAPSQIRVVPPDLEAPETSSALAAFRAGDEEKCLSLLRDAVAADPNLGPPELTLAVFNLQDGRRTRALQLLEKVAAEDSGHPLFHLAYAELALADGRLTEALMHYEKLAADGPPSSWKEEDAKDLNISILAGKATVAERRRNWEAAQTILAQWLQLHADNSTLRHRWAKALLLSGKETKALEQFDIAYRQDNKLNRPEASIGAEYASRGEFAKANDWFAKALKKYPEESTVHYAWAMALLYQDRADEAQEHASLAGKQGFETNKIDMVRGFVAHALEKHDEAVAHFARVLKRTPGDREASYYTVLALAAHPEEEKRSQAVNLAEALVKENPRSVTAIAALGAARQAVGDSASAEQTLAAIAVRPDARPETLLALGEALAAQNKTDAARRVAEMLKQRIDQPDVFISREAGRKWIDSTLR